MSQTFAEWWDKRSGPYTSYSVAGEAWHARDEEVAELTKDRDEWRDGAMAKDTKILDLHRQLEPSPCGESGHRMVDWITEISPVLEGDKIKMKSGEVCVACQREDAIRKDGPKPVHNGQLKLHVYTKGDKIAINFGQPITWMDLPLEAATLFADTIREKIMKLVAKEGKRVT